MHRAAILIVLLGLTTSGVATSLKTWERGEIVENPRAYSANKRFCVAARHYARVGDFEGQPAEIAFGWDEPPAPEGSEEPRQYTGALYDGRVLLAEFPIDVAFGQTFLVSDSGAYIVAQPGRVLAYIGFAEDDPFAAIYQDDGTLIRKLTAGDVFTANDLENLDRDLGLDLRVEEDRELLIVTVPASVKERRYEEIRIDLATGKLLDEKRDIYPVFRVWATVSDPLLAHTVVRPLPAYPNVARKARITGAVIVEVLVSETGEVFVAPRKGLPFGVTEAVMAAVKQWRFTPRVIDGRPVRMKGEIEFHFGPLERRQWELLIPPHPPSAPSPPQAGEKDLETLLPSARGEGAAGG